MNNPWHDLSNTDSTPIAQHDGPPSPEPGITSALQADLEVLAWLETDRQQLSAECTDYICSALLEWAMLGEGWPDPTEPTAGRDGDHLTSLVRITERLTRHVLAAQPRSRRYELAAVVRQLTLAIACQHDPQAVAESQWRETVHRQPWRAQPPTPVQLPDGRVL